LRERVRRTTPAAGIGAAALVAAGALLLLAALVVHLDRVLALHRALDPGVVGGAVLSLGQLALLPNLALWALGFVAGPGFALGTGTLVTPGGSDLGLLPLVPVLGAVPPPGALPTPFVAVVVVPVLVGMVVGYRAVTRSGREHDGPLDAVADALTAVVTTVLVLTALVALSGGAAGPGSLAAVGPSPWRVALALAGELAAGAAVAGWAAYRRRSA
ncbi:cell division protein PerM, partial [Angustibacter peucedani]